MLPARVVQVHDNLKKMLVSLQTGKEQAFSALVEEEALTLHAMMLTSQPGYILLKPGSLEVIDRYQAVQEYHRFAGKFYTGCRGKCPRFISGPV